MIQRHAFLMALALALATGLPVASLGQATSPGLMIRWEVDPDGTTSAASVVGLPLEVLATLQGPVWTPDRLAGLFSVAVDSKGAPIADRPAMLGSYRVESGTLRFTPRYSFDRGRPYVATFRPSKLDGGRGLDVASRHVVPKPDRPPTMITGVTPSDDLVPENLLKFYLFFSGPMARGEVYNRVRLLKADGQAVDLPFLRIAEELWDPTGTRLTLLIDPGRIKQGLKPREENGPVLEAGRTYTLVIDQAWPDAEDDPLGAGFRKTFRAGAADEVQPNPKTWTISRPAAMTREPLTITFAEPLDRALIASALTLVDPQGEPVAGRLDVEANETRWRFTPDTPWQSGDHQLLIDADLEDLAGNSILRPFEVDIQRDTPLRPEAKVIHLPIPIGAKGR